MRLIASVLSVSPEAALREIRDRRIWGRVALVAWQQRVGGVLLSRLRELDVDVPDEAVRELSAYARHVREANRIKIERVLPVVTAMTREGARCVFLKGAALLASVYSDWSMRPMVDVDLLIDPACAEIADGVLKRAGWEPGADLLRPDFFPRFHYEREYVTRSEPAVRIDLHVRPFRPLRFAFTIPPFAFMDATTAAELAGCSVSVLDAEMNLIHLAAHAALHGGRELRWLYDIYAWLRFHGDDLDASRIVDRCRAFRLEPAMRFALTRVKETLGPAGALTSILARLSKRTSMLDRLVLWQAPHGESRHATDVMVNSLSIPSWTGRVAYLSAVVLPGPAHLRQIYPHRHFGWSLAAHATRAIRFLAKPLSQGATS
ncbi:MAG: nucleotidyltransferase family protein [Phycisphaerales bacterium]|nr:nucleotidyltransferase family protein [Phycisphaerales bacterium]